MGIFEKLKRKSTLKIFQNFNKALSFDDFLLFFRTIDIPYHNFSYSKEKVISMVSYGFQSFLYILSPLIVPYEMGVYYL